MGVVRFKSRVAGSMESQLPQNLVCGYQRVTQPPFQQSGPWQQGRQDCGTDIFCPQAPRQHQLGPYTTARVTQQPAGLLTNRSVLSRLQPGLDKGVLTRGVALPPCSELGIWGCAGAPRKSSSVAYFVQAS